MGAAVSSGCGGYSSWWFGKRKIRVIIDGVSPAGKTSLLYKLKNPNEGIVSSIPTIGFNVESFSFEGHEITGWDLGGRDKARQLHHYYYPGTEALIYVVDSSDTDRLEYSRDEFHRLLHEEELRNAPVLLFCNKQDLPNAKNPHQIADFFGVHDGFVCGGRVVLVQGCSVLGDYGIREGLGKLYGALSFSGQAGKTNAGAGAGGSAEGARRRRAATKDKTFVERTGNVCLKRFERIKSSTECPFAKSARLWGGDALFQPGTTIEQQTKQHAGPLAEFTRRSNAGEALDGFCIEIDDDRARNAGPEEFGECVRRMLLALADLDPSGENSMRVRYIGSKGWRFRFNRTDFFVTTFAPCYPVTSSRYAFGSKSAFVLLQPERSFQRHDLPPDSADTNWIQPQNIRDKTRAAFRGAGRRYHIPATTRYPMADHIVKPLADDGGSVIAWWVGVSENRGSRNVT